MSGFAPLPTSRPYAWPLAGRWDTSDTALLMIDLQRDFLDPRGYFAKLKPSGRSLGSVPSGTQARSRMV